MRAYRILKLLLCLLTPVVAACGTLADPPDGMETLSDGPLQGQIEGKPFSGATGLARLAKQNMLLPGSHRAYVDIWSGSPLACKDVPSSTADYPVPRFEMRVAWQTNIYGEFDINGVHGFFVLGDGRRVTATGRFELDDVSRQESTRSTVRIRAQAEGMSIEGAVKVVVCGG